MGPFLNYKEIKLSNIVFNAESRENDSHPFSGTLRLASEDNTTVALLSMYSAE